MFKFAEIIDIKHLITPEDTIEHRLDGITIRAVAVVSKVVIYSRIGHSLVTHEVAVDRTQQGMLRYGKHTAKALTSIHIGDSLCTGNSNRVQATACLVVVEQGVDYTAI